MWQVYCIEIKNFPMQSGTSSLMGSSRMVLAEKAFQLEEKLKEIRSQKVLLLQKQRALQEEYNHQSQLVKQKVETSKRMTVKPQQRRFVTQGDQESECVQQFLPDNLLRASDPNHNRWISVNPRNTQRATVRRGLRKDNQWYRSDYSANAHRPSIEESVKKYTKMNESMRSSNKARASIDEIWKSSKDIGKARYGSYLYNA